MNKTTLAQSFQNYGREHKETRYIYLPDPRTLCTMDRLTYWGKRAANHIKEMEAAIETMNSYQSLIFDRVQELTTASYHMEIHLNRERRYDNKVKYYLTLKKVYDVPGIDPETLENTVYPGTDRSKSIKDFEAYKKSHPGIIAVKNIEKGRWEK